MPYRIVTWKPNIEARFQLETREQIRSSSVAIGARGCRLLHSIPGALTYHPNCTDASFENGRIHFCHFSNKLNHTQSHGTHIEWIPIHWLHASVKQWERCLKNTFLHLFHSTFPYIVRTAAVYRSVDALTMYLHFWSNRPFAKLCFYLTTFWLTFTHLPPSWRLVASLFSNFYSIALRNFH